MDRSFMPKIQSPLAVPTRAAPWVDASPPNEDGEVGVDKGSPRPSDLAPSPFFWSRPLSFMCSSSPPRLDAGEASLPSCADYLRLWCFAGHWAEVNRTVLHKAQESQGFDCFQGRTFPCPYWLACLRYDGRFVWFCPAIQVCRSSIMHSYDHLMSVFQCALINGRNFWVLYLTGTEFSTVGSGLLLLFTYKKNPPSVGFSSTLM
ncbi:uncharacterized protein [Triticum aestivum]|uniref:uncharacterized protein isoform X1 n=1 Tax=Triticum aestivum TaxID=4565 RepID=UPI001D00DB2C|nr:uncharacterized protein LOC123092542 isoform X1 [Triticum aestivum]